jgi:multidrug efflux pump subunit AcrA (membrane-fusion protein)
MNRRLEMSRGRVAIVVVVFLAVVFATWQLLAPPSAPPAGELEDETAQSVDRTVSSSAVIVPARQAKLGFQSSGRVREVLVKAGDAVKAGDPLLKLDDRELQVQVESARGGLALAQGSLAQVLAGSRPEEIAAAEAGLEGAAARFDQATGSAPAADIQTGEADLAAARERLAQAQAAARSEERAAEASRAAAQAKLDQLLAGPRAEDVRVAELALEQAKNTLWAAQIERDGLRAGRIPST